MKAPWGKKSPSKKATTEDTRPLILSTPDRIVQEAADDDTILQGNRTTMSSTSKKKSSASSKKKMAEQVSSMSLQEQVAFYKDQIAQEKAGKRKLFHSLVKLANELKRTRELSQPVLDQQSFFNRTWYEGGLWRSPVVLPGVVQMNPQQQQEEHQDLGESGRPLDGPSATTTKKVHKQQTMNTHRRVSALSLSDLFFHLVSVTAFTRVGVAVSSKGGVGVSELLYFAIFWTVWSKEAAYSTRFDTSDLSAQVETLITCFAVLFASLSVQSPLDTPDATRIMIMAAAVAVLHLLLHMRVALTTFGNTANNGNQYLDHHIRQYAIFNIVMNTLESAVWIVGIVIVPYDWPYRWAIFTSGIVLALRFPRAFLANDFHAACSQRSVLFILLLGFLLQSIVVVASEFFEYQTPSWTDYAFIGSACLMFFCIKLLYVDDSDTLAQDHALLVNRWAGFFFNVGNFCLLLSTTVMGSGLNLLTHSYLAATAALPGPEKNLVCGGFSAVLLSTFFIKSMHLKRVPTDRRNQALFVSAYVIQSLVLLAVVGITGAMCLGYTFGSSLLAYLMINDIELLFTLSGSALFVVVMSWLDEGVELALYESAEDSRAFRIHPFGFWWCLTPDITEEELEGGMTAEESQATRSLSVLSPLLGSSMADMKHGYDSVSSNLAV